MKTGKVLIAISALTICATNATAITQFKGTDSSSTSRVCLIAATKGFESANAFFESANIKQVSSISAVRCNGMSVADFSNVYFQPAQSAQTQSYVAKDPSIASQYCAKAANSSEQLARHYYHLPKGSVQCTEEKFDAALEKGESRSGQAGQ